MTNGSNAAQASTELASGIESGIELMFRPTQLFASALADMLKAQQQTWATMAASRGIREANRY